MKYDWRLRNVDGSTTDTALIVRLVGEYNKYLSFLSKSGTPTIALLSASSYSKVIYVHSELGDDTTGDGTPDKPYKSFAGGISNADNPITTATIVVAVGRFGAGLNLTGGNSGALVVADTYGSVIIDSTALSWVYYVGCYIKCTYNVTFRAVNCIIDCGGYGFDNKTSFNKCVVLNANMTGPINGSQKMANNVFINCTISVGNNGSYTPWIPYYCIFVNSNIYIYGQHTVMTNAAQVYTYNSIFTSATEGDSIPYTDIHEDGGYTSLNDCFVDPSHLNFDLKRSAMSNPIFANWIGWTGDSVDFVRVTGNNVQEDSGSWTIDQQTPGRFSLESAIIDNRGQFNQVFTGLATNVFHYATNEISIAPFERFGTPVVLASGDSSLIVSETTMYCVTQNCKIDNVAVNRYQNVILETGSYTITEHNGVKFYPYNYNNINNYILVRFTNLGRCTSVAANSTLKVGCTYLNQSSSVVTISDGTEVAVGGTYICDTANLTADGVLLKVFDDEINNWVPIPTHSFQTKYKAGYVVTNKKYQPAPNLLDFDGKTMPLTEAFGEYNDVNYLDSLNWQQDFLQFKVCGIVYNFS